MYPNLPVRHPKPDAKRFIDALMGRIPPLACAPMVEYLVDEVLRQSIGCEMLGQTWSPWLANNREETARYFDNFIDFWYRMGYDFVRFEHGLAFPAAKLSAADTAKGVTRQRSWADQHHGMIRTWEDFERYPWPKVEEYDFFLFEYISRHLPDGLGFIVCHSGGIFEHLSSMLSLEGLCFLLYDDPALVKAVANRTGELMAAFYEQLAGMDNIIAIFQGDDMGHKTGTMISPDDLRTYCLPSHKRFAEIAHAHGMPYFLHSCGNMFAVIEDLIEDVKLDGKHSYEDVIIPIEDFQRDYGNRLAVLGGMDIDILARATPEGVRQRAHQLMETCGPRGRFAIGSGSSIASYIPIPNYLAMLDEALGF